MIYFRSSESVVLPAETNFGAGMFLFRLLELEWTLFVLQNWFSDWLDLFEQDLIKFTILFKLTSLVSFLFDVGSLLKFLAHVSQLKFVSNRQFLKVWSVDLSLVLDFWLDEVLAVSLFLAWNDRSRAESNIRILIGSWLEGFQTSNNKDGFGSRICSPPLQEILNELLLVISLGHFLHLQNLFLLILSSQVPH